MEMSTIPESERQTVLDGYGLAEMEFEQVFDDIVAIAARMMNTPVAYFSLMEPTENVVKSGHGIDLCRAPRDLAVCNAAVTSDDTVVITDALRDPRWKNHPYVVDDPHLRAYVGNPIRGFGGMVIGTLCVYDVRPRTWHPADLKDLRRLADQIEAHMESRRLLWNSARDPQFMRSALDELSRTAEQQRNVNRRVLHDFRNIIASISANSEYLATCDDPVEREEVMIDIRDACEHGMALVTDVERLNAETDQAVGLLEHDTEVSSSEFDLTSGSHADIESGVS